MSEKSAIEWTDASWNPIKGMDKNRWQCRTISPGCDHCYASTFNRRLGGDAYPVDDGAGNVLARLDPVVLEQPIHWKKPRRIFVCSMTDIAGAWVSQEWFNRIMTVIWQTPHHSYQILTKRPARLKKLVEQHYQSIQRDPLPNVWMGVSVESDAYTWRAKVLAEIPAAVRFISAEPLLGPLPSLELCCAACSGRGVDPAVCAEDGCDHSPEDWCTVCDGTGRRVDWLITGGESGAGARPMHPDWARDLRGRCKSAGVAYFHKQNGEWAFDVDMAAYGVNAERWIRIGKKATGRLLDGIEWNEFPAVPVTR